jgi:hypothetical protein
MDQNPDHLTNSQAEQFRQHGMNLDEKARWERHMAGCNDCLELVYGKASSTAVSDRLVEALTLPGEKEFHLSSSELHRYASRSMDEADRIIFESHIEDCQACRSQADAMEATRLSTLPAKPLPAQPPSFWVGLVRFWQEPRFTLPVRAAVAVVLAACFFLSWVVWHRRNSNISQSTASDAAVVVRLRDGNTEITLDKNGTLAGLSDLDPAVSNAIREALTTAGLSRPQVLSELAGSEIKFMGPTGSSPPFALISPVDTVVEDRQPTLRWTALSGASSYTVAVFDPQFHPVTKTRLRQGTEWRVPTPLRPGATYLWQVTATKGTQQITVPSAPAPRAEFKVLDSQRTNALDKVKSVTQSHLALGVLYAREGLRMDAEREFDALARENPQSSLAAKLLSDVRSWER